MDMKGKVCVVTGANSGLGKVSATELARMGAHVVMVCRNLEKAEAARDEIRRETGTEALDLLQADLASLDSVRRVAGEINANYPRVDVLMNNAGLFSNERKKTADGFEVMFGVNHLAPFLLTNLLLEKLKKSGKARVVTVASGAHRIGKLDFDDLNHEKSFSGLRAYGTSKLENILFTRELARRIEGSDVTANCCHPGAVDTGIAFEDHPLFASFMRFFLVSPQKGARTQIWLASSDEAAACNGMYFIKCKPNRGSRASRDMEAALRLWEESARLVGLEEQR